MRSTGFRPELEGLRGVAVLLVAVYHVWLGRVSGGVDVFLMLTGFLLTGSLLRTAQRDGRVHFGVFWSRLARRLFPTSALVLLGVLAATYLWLPRNRWPDTLREAIAAALYYENWQLAYSSVDYLARDSAVSPVQHFWSLAIQGQFYLVIPVLVALAALTGRDRARHALLGLLAALFAGSLAYSVVVTAIHQPWAYFDTGARLWEFALGGIAAILFPLVRLPRALRIGLGWLGLAALVGCGLLLPVSTMFPGYVALWPTLAGLLVIAAGTTDSRIGADRLLTTQPLAYTGKISYALYLWHWPALVCYLALTGRGAADVAGGALVLAVSFLLAAATTWGVTGAVARFPDGVARSFALGAACLVVVTAAAGGAAAYLERRTEELTERQLRLANDQQRYPGAAALRDGRQPRPAPVVPDPAVAAQDVPVIYHDGCHQEQTRTAAIVCEYGDPDAETSIAVVGGSHAAHWFPALDVLARRHGWRLLNITMSSCQFSASAQRLQGRAYRECDRWQDNVLAELARRRPTAVLTNATRSHSYGEKLDPGYVARWKQLRRLGISVIAIRDTPRWGFTPAECVATKGREACVGDMHQTLAKVSPIDQLAEPPPNVTFADLNRYLCRDGDCPSVIGNVLVYRDSHHLTTVYARTLAPLLEPYALRAVRAA